MAIPNYYLLGPLTENGMDDNTDPFDAVGLQVMIVYQDTTGAYVLCYTSSLGISSPPSSVAFFPISSILSNSSYLNSVVNLSVGSNIQPITSSQYIAFIAETSNADFFFNNSGTFDASTQPSGSTTFYAQPSEDMFYTVLMAGVNYQLTSFSTTGTTTVNTSTTPFNYIQYQNWTSPTSIGTQVNIASTNSVRFVPIALYPYTDTNGNTTCASTGDIPGDVDLTMLGSILSYEIWVTSGSGTPKVCPSSTTPNSAGCVAPQTNSDGNYPTFFTEPKGCTAGFYYQYCTADTTNAQNNICGTNVIDNCPFVGTPSSTCTCNTSTQTVNIPQETAPTILESGVIFISCIGSWTLGWSNSTTSPPSGMMFSFSGGMTLNSTPPTTVTVPGSSNLLSGETISGSGPTTIVVSVDHTVNINTTYTLTLTDTEPACSSTGSTSQITINIVSQNNNSNQTTTSSWPCQLVCSCTASPTSLCFPTAGGLASTSLSVGCTGSWQLSMPSNFTASGTGVTGSSNVVTGSGATSVQVTAPAGSGTGTNPIMLNDTSGSGCAPVTIGVAWSDNCGGGPPAKVEHWYQKPWVIAIFVILILIVVIIAGFFIIRAMSSSGPIRVKEE